MEGLAEELDMFSVQPNQRSYRVAQGAIANSPWWAGTSLAGYYDDDASRDSGQAKVQFTGGSMSNDGAKRNGGVDDINEGKGLNDRRNNH
jgi:hypothetical protein